MFHAEFPKFSIVKGKGVVLFCWISKVLLDLPSEETQPVNKFLQCKYLYLMENKVKYLEAERLIEM